MYEVHAWKKSGLLFKRVGYYKSALDNKEFEQITEIRIKKDIRFISLFYEEADNKLS